MTSAACYRFGHFELQPDERRLLAAGAPVAVRPRAIDLLLVLVERAGHLVTKDELLERVWSKVIVEENTLRAQVSLLRKILGPEAIATVSAQGYRFTLEVTCLGAARAPPATTPKHNLPQQLTSFIGREKAIAELEELLGATRLLTLIGAGGCGKTRLAMQVAGDLLESYSDGIWLVELAALAEPGLVPQTVANVLGLKEQPGENLTQTIIEHLASKHLLLVLDNAEHLLAACAEFADAALRRCARLIILVTSRERLGVAGELTYRVPSLSVPDPKRDITPEVLSEYESARLFIERARLTQPHFTVTEENAPALASVCYRLDGIPLAIELAAPRVRSMSVEEVNRRLDQRFDLLTEGSRTALPRQRTLRAMIDWSHDLLSDAERAILRRVSVFSGGWTLAVAEQVCSGDVVDHREAFDLLTSLADKNLVLAEAHGGATRYGLLETVRHYALERLREHDEEARWRGRHLAYFLALAEEAEPQLQGSDQQAWHDRLEAEHDNLRSALSWSSAAGGDAVGGLRLAGAISWFWAVRGYSAEGRGWFSALLAVAPKGQDEAVRARALRGAGRLAHAQGDYSAAKALRQEGLAIWKELGNREGIVQSVASLGTIAQSQGDYPTALALFKEALAIRRELGDRHGIARSLISLGHSLVEQGDYPGAGALLEESLAISRELGDWHNVAEGLYHLGTVAYFQSDYLAAQARLEENLTIRRELRNPNGIASALAALGLVAHDTGDYPNARILFKEALGIQRELGERRSLSESMEAFAAVAFALTGPGPAARIWGRAERLREEIGAPIAPSARPWYDRQVTAARAAFGDDVVFDLAWQEGRAMNLEQAVQYALDAEKSST
jgi:predicted ATPase/DNA-binding winged helix-turn-helix (wHTH) protein